MTASAYAAAVLASKPGLYWKLADPPDSTYAADEIQGSHALLYGSYVLGVLDPWGTAGAVRFDGYSGQVVDQSLGQLSGGPFTIECWFRAMNNGAVLVECNTGKTAAASNSYNPALVVWSNNQLNAICNPASPLPGAGSNVNDSTWHHAAFTWDGSVYTLYLDGVVLGPTVASQSRNALQGYWRFGHGYRIGGYLSGDMAHVAIYGRALSQSEILGHISATPGSGLPGGSTCVRRAWLSLPDGRSLSLEGPSYKCSKLDLGSPTVRDVVNNRPDNDGTADRTSLLGSRVVTAEISAFASVAKGRIDEIASAFGPYMNPAARPTLHYVLDRGYNPERTLVLRAASVSWPIVGADQRDLQLSWVAPFPLAIDPATKSAVTRPGTGMAGRTYSWTPPRVYPAGSGSPMSGRVVTLGDTWTRPTLRIYGPMTGPQVQLQPDDANLPYGFVPFVSSFNINAGDHVTVDCDAHHAYMNEDPTNSVLPSLDWWNLRWPVLDPSTGYTATVYAPSGAIASSQVEVTWNDRYFA